MRAKVLGFIIVFFVVIHFPLSVVAQNQTPDTLCKCNGDDSSSHGGLRSWEEFAARYQGRYKSEEEGRLAWRVYQAANRCNAVMVIGRLDETEGFEGKNAHCVLRTLKDWTVFINDVFIQAGIDRQARFLLASSPPGEPQGVSDPIDVDQFEGGRETSWEKIYNHEIYLLMSSGQYRLAGDVDGIRPDNPSYFLYKREAETAPEVAGKWQGTLVVREVQGTSRIQPGLRRKAALELVQGGPGLVLRFSNQEVSGSFLASSPGLAELADNPTGSLARAEIEVADPVSDVVGHIKVTTFQRSGRALIISQGIFTRQ